MLRIRAVVRWTRYNDHEGVIHGELDGVPVTCYVLVVTGHWDQYQPGMTMPVDAWVERSGDVETLPPASPAALTQVDEALYDVTGVVRQQDGELVQVDSILPIRVDLDPPFRRPPPQLRTGDVVRVRGVMKIGFFPDGPAGAC